MQRFKSFLTEAVNYEEIFNSLYKAIPGLIGHTEPFVKSEIDWAKKTLKKQDRIVWYLQWVRLALVDEWGTDKVKESEHKKIVKANPGANDNRLAEFIRPFYKRNLPQMHDTLQHYYSMNVPKIEKYVFTNYVIWDRVDNDLHKLEQDWTTGHEGAIKYLLQPLEHHDPNGDSNSGITIIKQFPHDYFWVNLKTHSCELEAKAMGHCGNTAAGVKGENVLSFRKLVKKGKDESHWFWEPHLTFILDAKGFLGEMKGRANDKPTETYHKYIIALLEDPIIKGIKGGGYAPERNFDMKDLTDEQRDKLFDKKPSLMGIKDYFKKMGKTPDLIEKISAAWNDARDNSSSGIALVWDETQDHAAIAKFSDIHDFIDDHGNDTMKWCSKVMQGDENDAFWSDYVYEGNIEDVLGMLDEAKVKAYLAETYPEEWEEDEENSDLIDFIKDNDSELYDAIERAARRGEETGAENDMSEDFTKALDSDVEVLGDYDSELGYAYFNKADIWDEPVFLWATFKNIMDMVCDEDFDRGISGYKVSMDSPYNGWSGFDEEAAKESILDEFPELGA